MKKNFIICFILFNLVSFSNQNFLIHKLETDFQNKIIKNKTDILNNSIYYNDIISSSLVINLILSQANLA